MRRLALTSIAALSLLALSAACATSPADDDLGGLVSETHNAEPDEDNSAKLPPPSTGEEPADEDDRRDAGVTKDSGSKPSTPPAKDSGSPAASVDCDVNDPLKLLVWQFEVSSQSAPVPCPCSAGQCCYMGSTCVSAL